MMLMNRLKSPTWKSLVHLFDRRPRRRSTTIQSVGRDAAEVLEERQLLSGNVVAGNVGAAITLTSDNGGNTVNVFRLDPTTVEIDGLSGTTINGAPSVTFAISSVSSLTANLGAGYDTFNIYDLSTTGNINVNGASSADGFNVEINSKNSGMTIGGSIVAKLGTLSGSDSHFFVSSGDSSAASLTVKGSINVTGSVSSNSDSLPFLDVETFSGAASLIVDGSMNYHLSGISQIYSSVNSFAGNLIVKGSVNVALSNLAAGEEFEMYTFGGGLTVDGALTVTQSGTARQSFKLWTTLASNLTIGHDVTSTMSSSDVEHDRIFTDNGGNIRIGGSVVQSGSTSDAIDNSIDTTFGSITIAGSVTQTARIRGNAPFSVHTISNSINAANDRNITIGGSVTINSFGGDYHDNEISTNASGNISVGVGVTINDSGASFQTINDVFTNGLGRVAIGPLGLTINESASASADASFNQVFTQDAGTLTVHGLVTINAANNSSSFYTRNFVGTLGGAGAFSASGIVIANSGTQEQQNAVQSDVGPVKIGLRGVAITGSGSGAHHSTIQAASDPGSTVTIAGSVNVVDQTTGAESLEVDGAFIGGSLFVAMPGSGAEIDVNNGNGFQPTTIGGLFTAVMTGSSPLIKVAAGSGSGYSPVTIGAGVVLLGSKGAAATFTYKAGNLTTPFFASAFFTIVTV